MSLLLWLGPNQVTENIEWTKNKRSTRNTFFLTHYYWLKIIENYKIMRGSLNNKGDPQENHGF